MGNDVTVSDRVDRRFDRAVQSISAGGHENGIAVKKDIIVSRVRTDRSNLKLVPRSLPVSSITRNYEQRVPFDGASFLTIHPVCFSILVTSPLIFLRPPFASPRLRSLFAGYLELPPSYQATIRLMNNPMHRFRPKGRVFYIYLSFFVQVALV